MNHMGSLPIAGTSHAKPPPCSSIIECAARTARNMARQLFKKCSPGCAKAGSSPKLKSAGAKVTWLTYQDGGHGVYGAKLKETAPAMQKFFDEALGKK